MPLSSFSFFTFLTIVLLLYWKFAKKYQWALLLLTSYYFYASWKPGYLGIILITTLINYFGALKLHERQKYKKLWFVGIVTLNLLALLIFKYFNFFALTLNDLTDWHLPQFKWLVPLGISFYTLQVIGYLSDVYHAKIPPEKHLGIFALFVSFFPQISAGPIARGKHLLPQLRQKHAFDYANTVSGVQLFTFGMFKKLVIADNLGTVVDHVFATLPEYKGLSLILAITFYTWQIYMDFSGYTDMARGVARMLGFDLIENFHLPYIATSVRDFWRRWHISFSSWLKDYVYIPLGGNRRGMAQTIINTLIVFTVSGLWHGAAWTFVVWGALHGIWISGERFLQKMIAPRLQLPRILQIGITYTALSIFWVFFRAEKMNDAFYILRSALVGVKNFVSPSYIIATFNQLFLYNGVEMTIVLSVLTIAILSEILRTKYSLTQLLARQHVIVRFVVYTLVVFAIMQLRNSQIKQFIYTRF